MAARRQLGLELRQLRERAQRSGDSVARAVAWSPSKVSRYEWSKTVPVPREVDKLLGYFGITGPRRDYLLQLAETAHQASWWDAYAADIPVHQREFIGLEHAAADILIWQASIIPPLLQTEAYARHVVSSTGRVEVIPPRKAARRVEVTMHRQHLLGRESPPRITVVLDEAILRRPAGTAEVMQKQLHRLASLAGGHPAVTLQVLPLASPQPVFSSSFTILGFGSAIPEAVLPDMVAIDHFSSSCLVEDEQEAYLYQLAFQRLAAAALDPAKSQSLIHKLSGATRAAAR
jgi:Domain of unknown function (DUF5753)/Helix-turn-helix domain